MFVSTLFVEISRSERSKPRRADFGDFRPPPILLQTAISELKISAQTPPATATSFSCCPSEMTLPVELYRTIASGLRESSADALTWKTRKEWMEENGALLSLMSVSRAWMREALPILHSEIFVEAFSPDDDAHREEDPNPRLELYANQLSNVLMAMKKPGSRFVINLKALSIDLHPKNGTQYRVEAVPPDFFARIHQILSLTSHLQYLRLSVNAQMIPLSAIFIHLSSLRFPHLRVLRLGLLTASNEPTIDAAKFLGKHPELKDVSLWFYDFSGESYPWRQLRSEDPLPNLERMHATFEELRMLASSKHLTVLQYDRQILEVPEPELDGRNILDWEFSQFSGPFIHVTHLSISNEYIVLDGVGLRALVRQFPALEVLDGAECTKEFISFMETNTEDLSSCLPKLHTLTMYEVLDHIDADYPLDINTPFPPDNPERDIALCSLPQLFPALLCVVLRGEDNWLPRCNALHVVRAWAFEPEGIVGPYIRTFRGTRSKYIDYLA
ncbi:hypothetical protein SISNIDRAFT_463268 [Sistotremastrum niveocremeum HHB9708]|uniref:F-box domain-containing protein n=1 Tax=Sistotremastrum niveocremeum HHB9708 TaxID=1314777 RepID=A0A164YYC4_9AGAM|nr:hypothetical protein SISNIDRAFT_463268 [Sistotremastrum niveocremeum HHB9708]